MDPKVDGASINFPESVSMVPLSTFVETFAKFAQISLKKKGRGVSEGPRREKNSEKSQNTTPFRNPGYGFNHACHWFGRNAQFPQENGDLGGSESNFYSGLG